MNNNEATALEQTLNALDYTKVVDLSDNQLITLLSCDWEEAGISLYMMGLIQQEFNLRRLSY